MRRERIVGPIKDPVDGMTVLNVPAECPGYLVQAVYRVNLTGGEEKLRLPNGQEAILSPGTDMSPLARLAESEEFLAALDDAAKESGVN